MPRAGLDLQTIVQTAAQIADEAGVEAVSLAAVAKKLSIRSPSLFNHIKGLPGLRKELSQYGLEKLYNALLTASDGKHKDEAIFAMAAAYLNFTRTHPGLYELTISAPDPKDKEVEKISNNIIALLTKILSDYDLVGDDAIHAVRGLRSILHGFSSLEQKGGFGLPLKIEDSFQILINGFILGLSEMKSKS